MELHARGCRGGGEAEAHHVPANKQHEARWPVVWISSCPSCPRENNQHGVQRENIEYWNSNHGIEPGTEHKMTTSSPRISSKQLDLSGGNEYRGKRQNIQCLQIHAAIEHWMSTVLERPSFSG